MRALRKAVVMTKRKMGRKKRKAVKKAGVVAQVGAFPGLVAGTAIYAMTPKGRKNWKENRAKNERRLAKIDKQIDKFDQKKQFAYREKLAKQAKKKRAKASKRKK